MPQPRHLWFDAASLSVLDGQTHFPEDVERRVERHAAQSAARVEIRAHDRRGELQVGDGDTARVGRDTWIECYLPPGEGSARQQFRRRHVRCGHRRLDRFAANRGKCGDLRRCTVSRAARCGGGDHYHARPPITTLPGQ